MIDFSCKLAESGWFEATLMGENDKVEITASNLSDAPYDLIIKIEQYVESTNNYRLRRIEWAKIELEKEGKSASPNIILRKAGIRTEVRNKFRQLLLPDVC